MQMNVAGGVRQSTANAYLAPARKRSNLTIITGVMAQRVLLDGTRATGVGNYQGWQNCAGDGQPGSGPRGRFHRLADALATLRYRSGTGTQRGWRYAGG